MLETHNKQIDMVVLVLNSSSYIPEKKKNNNDIKKHMNDEIMKKKQVKRIKIDRMAKQCRVREKIVLLSNKCYDNPDLEICDIYWSYLDNVEMVLDKHETLISKKSKPNNSKEGRWDVI